MDYDVNNHEMLSAGAYYSHHGEAGGGWRPMNSAPRDGTPVEIRCTYGVAPWYGIYRWTTKSSAMGTDGKVTEFEGAPSWQKVPSDGGSFDEWTSFSWRPFRGDVAQYKDPTGGAQDSMAYWRGAAAVRHGLPLDAFENDVQENISAKPKPFWMFW